MLISTMIMGWIGVLIYIIIVFTFQKMAKHNEYAFMHILMAIMYAMWLPLPLVLYRLVDSEILQVGTIFGLVYLIMIVITMALQTGHITYTVKHNEDGSISEKHGNYMMATLSNPFEGFTNVFKSIWTIFLAIAFWNNGEMIMASLMTLYSLLLFYYLSMLLDTSLVKRVNLFSKFKPNPFIINLETLFFFIILMSYISF
ncbi:hypothetical protein GMD78_06185 [Ornithinibacillus sp. L9]|uniref:Uncharacterized protein n=1 Tax=Ornithinibacillus caprae TaxID=2678566 RepID=A0A6N8FH18_9BACI|nr:hypothetical protein [Ornithinibacillus caprae]MUK87986.1 hypothetical protein [Ornithinibacillus caprae]